MRASRSKTKNLPASASGSVRSAKMTTTVSHGLRILLKVLAAELGENMDDLQWIALRSMIAKFKVPNAERRKVWEELWKEFGGEREDEAHD
jgi:hypothetical protein